MGVYHAMGSQAKAMRLPIDENLDSRLRGNDTQQWHGLLVRAELSDGLRVRPTRDENIIGVFGLFWAGDKNNLLFFVTLLHLS